MSDNNGVFYFLGNITSHVLHALPLYEKLGGTFVVTSERAKKLLEDHAIPVVVVDDVPFLVQRVGRLPRRVHEYITLTKRHKATIEYLNHHARVVIFYELFDLRAAGQLSEPTTIFLTHGNMLKSYMTMHPERIDIINNQYDFMAAIGPRMKQQFSKDGVEPAKLLDIGIARTDLLVRKSKTTAAREVKRSLNIVTDNPFVTYVPTFWGASSVYDLALPLIESIPDTYNLLIRPHPQTPEKIIRPIRNACDIRTNVHYVGDESHPRVELVDCLSASSVIIGDMSSVMLEAILLDTPLIFAFGNNTWRQDDDSYKPIEGIVEYSQKLTTDNIANVGDILKVSLDLGTDAATWSLAKRDNFFNYSGGSVDEISRFISRVASKASG